MTLFPKTARFIQLLAALAMSFTLAMQPAQAERIKDIGQFAGLRTNQLVGYGIVVGLAGIGDDSLEYATLGVRGMTSRFGLPLPPGIHPARSEEHTSELQSRENLVCR